MSENQESQEPVAENTDGKRVKEQILAAPPLGIKEENIRQTTVPIPASALREYFENKELFFVVNYDESRMKGNSFLTYLTNLNVPCDVKFNTPMEYETYSEILLAYMNQASIVECAGLHVLVAEMILMAKGLAYESSPYALPIGAEFPKRFIDENKELVGKWLHFLDSTQVYALTAIMTLNKHYQPKDRFPNVDDKDYVGRNIAMLYRLPEFMGYYFAVPDATYTKMSYFTQQYEQYMFKNERLAHYFRSRNNWAALMFEQMAIGSFKPEDIGYGIFRSGVFDPNSPFFVEAPYVYAGTPANTVQD